jgi:hypothetical protein
MTHIALLGDWMSLARFSSGNCDQLFLLSIACTSLALGRIGLVARGDLQAASVLSFLSRHLNEKLDIAGDAPYPPESLSLSGCAGGSAGALALTCGSPHRTVADSGLGARFSRFDPSLALPSLDSPEAKCRLLALPWCIICQVAHAAAFSCRRRPPHSCCSACAHRYAATALSPDVVLRCPFPNCPHSFRICAQLAVTMEASRRASAERIAAQRLRLRAAQTGAGDEHGLHAALPSMRSCPGCSVLTVKDEGCEHVQCAVCGSRWSWV